MQTIDSLKSYISVCRGSIEQKETEIKKIESSMNDAIRKVTELCSHTLVFEGCHDVCESFGGGEYTVPPFRVCAEYDVLSRLPRHRR